MHQHPDSASGFRTPLPLLLLYSRAPCSNRSNARVCVHQDRIIHPPHPRRCRSDAEQRKTTQKTNHKGRTGPGRALSRSTSKQFSIDAWEEEGESTDRKTLVSFVNAWVDGWMDGWMNS
jgi:hypothetical protein